jgi:hypothetical protein
MRPAEYNLGRRVTDEHFGYLLLRAGLAQCIKQLGDVARTVERGVGGSPPCWVRVCRVRVKQSPLPDEGDCRAGVPVSRGAFAQAGRVP